MSDLQRGSNDTLSPEQLAAIQRVRDQTQELREEVDANSLDDELDELASLVDEQAEQEVQPLIPIQEEIQKDILQLLSKRDDAPSQEQIQAWKEQFGDDAVQLLGLDKDNVYVYTHLTLPQWEKINEIVSKARNTPLADKIEGMVREKVIRTAVLWPKLEPQFFKTCRAGLPDTLYQLILIHSYFLSPQQAMTLTTQL